jgi:hypothetical protein
MPTAKFTTTPPRTKWISGRAAARLGLPRQHLSALARGGFIRSWKLPVPGSWVRYSEEDCVRLLPGGVPSPPTEAQP